jgi:hypothetical protein
MGVSYGVWGRFANAILPRTCLSAERGTENWKEDKKRLIKIDMKLASHTEQSRSIDHAI